MSSKKIIIGSRGSDLALWQANFIKDQLVSKNMEAEIKIIKTQGDRIQNVSLDKLEGKGFFTKELEEALLNKEIDLAVHSYKDCPTEQPDGLMLAAVTTREDAHDLLLIHEDSVDKSMPFDLKAGATVGTSSNRRKSQMKFLRPDVMMKDLRGNVPTRVDKVKSGEYDAIVIAAAGINRLELDIYELHEVPMEKGEMVSAPAQGALAIQIRSEDDSLQTKLDFLNDMDTLVVTNIERELLSMLGGGCHMPLGVHCTSELNDNDKRIFKLHVSQAEKDTDTPLQFTLTEPYTNNLTIKAFNIITKFKPAKVFVSRDERKNDMLCDGLKAIGCDVQFLSLIDLKPLPLRLLPLSDWIFFSSKHAVRFFFDQKPPLRGHEKFGAIGKSTNEEVKKYGKRCDFIGQSTDTKLVGKQFAARVGNQKALFPVAKDSMRSIQWQFAKPDNAMDLFIYSNNKVNGDQVKDADVYVFTSPSNFESFAAHNKPDPSKIYIAMGEATGKALEKAKIKNYYTPDGFEDLYLYRKVIEAIGRNLKVDEKNQNFDAWD